MKNEHAKYYIHRLYERREIQIVAAAESLRVDANFSREMKSG